MKLLVIDNFDSFTYNLVQFLGELGAELSVFRNDAITVQGIRDAAPDGIVISPGPGTPDDAGVSLDLIRELHQEIPIFGVCLGHQSIGQAFGGKVISAPTLMHGKTSQVQHQSENVFAKLPNPFRAMRYHSLAVERESLPDCLHITAETPEGVIMGFTHKEFPVYGVQFHPESFLTEGGKQILSNFLALTANRV
ncbi:MAG: aminodeoxychorismate/anthranilate synthase component II [Calditrichaeota bacterium]|nr:aminodeoxychorismate/anthranilate synthase component II [Calditrichota bacterium]MCB0269269.1 aminodeoxychorismate/anthranilate synthase component II [Calditrichota bacterium]MCB0287032.1 aminodeoxychorismate/anthranilate synthase component II [Calditrichota bacterium]MCB9068328.1 aminodeoxychorismate/anthranilate synthase component II [Calditrichia bacterium]